MTSVACISASYCIAVGQTKARLAGAWAWNGSAWTEQAAYNPDSTENVLNAISCKSAAWCVAVGAYGNGGTTFPLAEIWNGATWRHQSTSGAPPGLLAGVSCGFKSKFEAVGFNSYEFGVLAMGLYKSKWLTQTVPYIRDYYENGVSCWSTGCTAVGSSDGLDDFYDAASLNTLAEYWNGTSWRLQGAIGSGNPASSGAEWNGVQCRSATKCTAVGAWGNERLNETPSTLVSTWNGNTWTQQTTPDPGNSTNALTGVACPCGTPICEAVGWAAPNTLAMRN